MKTKREDTFKPPMRTLPNKVNLISSIEIESIGEFAVITFPKFLCVLERTIILAVADLPEDLTELWNFRMWGRTFHFWTAEFYHTFCSGGNLPDLSLKETWVEPTWREMMNNGDFSRLYRGWPSRGDITRDARDNVVMQLFPLTFWPKEHNCVQLYTKMTSEPKWSHVHLERAGNEDSAVYRLLATYRPDQEEVNRWAEKPNHFGRYGRGLNIYESELVKSCAIVELKPATKADPKPIEKK